MPTYPTKPATRTLPCVALALLLSAYMLLGLFLADLSIFWMGWVFAIAGIVLVTIVFTSPKFNIEQQISQWLRSDTSSFILLIVSAALVSVVLLWLHIFLKIIAILAAEVLVRLELHRHSFSISNSFWLLIVTSITGLILGWFAHYFI